MNTINNNKGLSMTIAIISMVAILGMTSLVIDVGITMLEKQKLLNSIDAVALAAAQNLTNSDESVIDIAKYYGQLNGVSPSDLNITITPDRKSVQVEAQKNIKYYFAKIFGFNEKLLSVNAKVKVAPLTSYRGIRPLVVKQQEFDYNKQYILKEDSGDGLSGNYGVVALGSNGASTYEENFLNGYEGKIKIGDTLMTQTGNITQSTRRAVQALINSDIYSTYDNFSKDSSRLIIIPVVDTLDVNGKKPVNVVGFAAFFLEGLQGNGGNTEILGRFVKHVAEGDSNDNVVSYGTYGVKLVK